MALLGEADICTAVLLCKRPVSYVLSGFGECVLRVVFYGQSWTGVGVCNSPSLSG